MVEINESENAYEYEITVTPYETVAGYFVGVFARTPPWTTSLGFEELEVRASSQRSSSLFEVPSRRSCL